MVELIKVFVISFISDIDNVIIYASILRRKITFPIILVLMGLLALSRTVYVKFVHELNNLPGAEMVIGLILLFISFKMATRNIDADNKRGMSLSWPIIYILILDLFLALDGVLLVSAVSENVLTIILGISVSLLILLSLSTLLYKIIEYFTWVFIVVSSYISFIAIETIINDPFIFNKLITFHHVFPILDFLPILSRATAISVLLLGIYVLSKNNQIYTVR